VNEDIAKGIFEETNNLIERRFDNESTRGNGIEAVVENYALSFTGKNGEFDYVKTDFNPDAHFLRHGFTWSFWFRPDELTGTRHALGRRAGSGNHRFFFGIAGSRLVAGIGEGILNGGASTSYHGMEVGEWYHWAITYTGDSNTGGDNTRLIYKNGVLHYPTDPPGNVRWRNPSDGTSGGEDIYFGGRNNNGNLTNSMACAFDEIAIYNHDDHTPKDSDWVSTVYNSNTDYNHKVSGGSGLVGYWRFNEGGGTTTKDLSGNGNHGTFVPIGTVNHTGNGTITTALPTWIER